MVVANNTFDEKYFFPLSYYHSSSRLQMLLGIVKVFIYCLGVTDMIHIIIIL